jgi:hypothetical protein
LANYHFDTESNRVKRNEEGSGGAESGSSTRFAVLRDGVVFFEGTPEQLEAAHDAYLKRFLV